MTGRKSEIISWAVLAFAVYWSVSSFRYWVVHPELTQMQVFFNLVNVLAWR